MTRVIAGSAGGRRLRVPAGRDVRPTADRIKEAMFSALGDLRGDVVLDPFAGTGGLGIEALSRGAAHAVFVERGRREEVVLRHNIGVAGVADRATIVAADARAFARSPSGGPFTLLLLDPPYAMPLGDVEAVVAALAEAGALAPGARVVLERDRRREEPVPSLLSHDRDRTYGETILRYLSYAGPTRTGPARHRPDDDPEDDR